MLLGLINLGSSSAFTAFVSVGVQALALAYGIPIAISLVNKREQVLKARWNLGRIIGPIVNVVALCWIGFELVLFSMPTALPVTATSMNYASVVLVGFGAIAAVWYAVHSRKCKLSAAGDVACALLTETSSLPWPAGFGRFVATTLINTYIVCYHFPRLPIIGMT